MPAPEIRLNIDNLTCVRGEQPVFSNLSVEILSGNNVILRGPNGSGKSSLLRILAGFLKPFTGHITWNGADIRQIIDIYRLSTHYVGHLEAIKPSLTVNEHLTFWASAKGMKKPAPSILKALDLEELANVPARFLSAGQKRRLSLTRLLASPASLWLLDEPLITLDTESTSRLQIILNEHAASGGLAIIATHTDVDLLNSLNIDMRNYSPHVQAIHDTDDTKLGLSRW